MFIKLSISGQFCLIWDISIIICFIWVNRFINNLSLLSDMKHVLLKTETVLLKTKTVGVDDITSVSSKQGYASIETVPLFYDAYVVVFHNKGKGCASVAVIDPNNEEKLKVVEDHIGSLCHSELDGACPVVVTKMMDPWGNPKDLEKDPVYLKLVEIFGKTSKLKDVSLDNLIANTKQLGKGPVSVDVIDGKIRAY